MKNEIAQALMHVNFAFSEGDDESINELNKIEAYIKKLEEKNHPEIAMIVHYLAVELLKSDHCIGDMFGIGEDDFVMELYPYANKIAKMTDEAYLNGSRFQGVHVYECMRGIAEFFWGIVERQNARPMDSAMPEMDEFELDVARVIDSCSLR